MNRSRKDFLSFDFTSFDLIDEFALASSNLLQIYPQVAVRGAESVRNPRSDQMNELSQEARRFRQQKDEMEKQARQTVAFFLISGIDLDDALASTGSERRRITARIARLIERERLKGVRRHWSYDINRHIALKQALDRLIA